MHKLSQQTEITTGWSKKFEIFCTHIARGPLRRKKSVYSKKIEVNFVGRNKEPVSLILAKGKSHHITHKIEENRRESELPVIAENIRPPDFLNDSEKAKFTEIADILQQLDIMSDLDCDVLGRYVKCQSDWETYSELVKKAQSSLQQAFDDGDYDVIRNYTSLLSKYEGLRAKAFSQCQTCASSLGLTITSRCKIVMPQKIETPKENKFNEFVS